MKNAVAIRLEIEPLIEHLVSSVSAPELQTFCLMGQYGQPGISCQGFCPKAAIGLIGPIANSIPLIHFFSLPSKSR